MIMEYNQPMLFFAQKRTPPVFSHLRSLVLPRNDPQGPKGPEDADAFEEAATAGHGQIHNAYDDLDEERRHHKEEKGGISDVFFLV